MMTSICPGCKTRREHSEESAGSTFRCPCGADVQVPRPTFASLPATDLRPGARWYYERDGAAAGPISEPELRRLAETWELSANDRVWSGGMAGWQPAASVLTGVFPDTPPPAAEHGWSALWIAAVVLMTLALASVMLLAAIAVRGAPAPPPEAHGTAPLTSRHAT